MSKKVNQNIKDTYPIKRMKEGKVVLKVDTFEELKSIYQTVKKYKIGFSHPLIAKCVKDKLPTLLKVYMHYDMGCFSWVDNKEGLEIITLGDILNSENKEE